MSLLFGRKVPTSCKAGNAVAGRWARARNSDKKIAAEYEAIKGEQAKADYRKKWAKKEFDKHVTVFKKVRSETREHWKNSEYLAIGRIAWLEGGGKAGWAQERWRCKSTVKRVQGSFAPW